MLISPSPLRVLFKGSMNTKRTSTITIFTASLAVLSVGFFIFFLYLVYQKNSEVSLLSQELEIAAREENSGIAMKRLLTNTNVEREKLDGYFLKSDTIVSFIESIESLSKLAKVDTSVNNVGIDQGGSKDTFEYVSLSGTAEGSFNNLYWLLSLIESMPMKLEVSKVFVEKMPTDPKSKEAKWRMVFIVRALKLK